MAQVEIRRFGDCLMKSVRAERRSEAVRAGQCKKMSPVVDRVLQGMTTSGVPRRKVRTAIAEVCNITPQSVARWFNGSTIYPRADHLARIADVYNIDLRWLILGDDMRDL